MLILLLFFQTLAQLGVSAAVPPTWVTSSLVKAGQANVINNVLTGNKVTPSATMPFSSAFSALPNLGYGIIGYEGIV